MFSYFHKMLPELDEIIILYLFHPVTRLVMFAPCLAHF